MTPRTLANRYAEGLLTQADRLNTVEEFESQLLALKEAFEKDSDFRALLIHPRIPRARKKAVIHRIFGGRAHATFVRFLELVVDKHRAAFIPEIADAFDRLADRSRGVVRVEVRSFLPLSPAHRQTLHDRISGMLGRKVDLQEKADPKLKGGLQVRIGDTIIDGSAAGRLRRLREEMVLRNPALASL
jgi:F-type H+-transporting ATPase subunit delta